MRQMIYIFCFFLTWNGFAQNEPIFEQGKEMYKAEKYQQALEQWNKILDNGAHSAALYFNLGNAYYKTGDINMALLNFERAKLLAPNNQDIDFNIKMANQFVVTSIEPLPLPFFLRWRTSVINMYSSDNWAYISIFSFIAFLILIGLFIFSRIVVVRRISFLTGIIILIFSGFTFSFAAKQKKKIVERKNAIVFCPRVTVKSSPSQTGTDLFLIYEGLKVQITDSINTWKEIKLADGNEGWLPDSCIVKI